MPINSAGCFYLKPAGSRDVGEEYVYTLSCMTSPRRIMVDVVGHGERLFSGSMTHFGIWLDEWAQRDEEG